MINSSSIMEIIMLTIAAGSVVFCFGVLTYITLDMTGHYWWTRYSWRKRLRWIRNGGDRCLFD